MSLHDFNRSPMPVVSTSAGVEPECDPESSERPAGKPSSAPVAPAEPVYRRLVFNQAEASVRFDGFRMMLIYSTLLAQLKRELIAQGGVSASAGRR